MIKKRRLLSYDQVCKGVIKSDKNAMIPWYLMAAYAYYEEDSPIITDGLFDSLAKEMLECWKNLKHGHKHLITEDDLRAGTLICDDYPLIVFDALNSLRKRDLKYD